jgi:hypothetical protein
MEGGIGGGIPGSGSRIGGSGLCSFTQGPRTGRVTLIQTASVPGNSVTAISPWEMPRDEIHLENREEVFFSGVVLLELFHEICALRCQKDHQAAHLQAHFVLMHAHIICNEAERIRRFEIQALPVSTRCGASIARSLRAIS